MLFVILIGYLKNILPVWTYWCNSLKLHLLSNLSVIFCNDKTGYNSLLGTLTIGYYSLGWALYSCSAG